MESFGNLNLLWTRGYNGSKVQYVDADHFCFVSGKTVVFVDEDGEETLFEFKGATIKSFSVHTSNKCFAIGEQTVSPNIYIYNYPELEQISILKGVFTHEVYLTTMSLANKISLLGEEWKLRPATVTCFLDDDTKVEFTMLAFSASDYLASLSGVPDYKLSIWKYEKCEKLCSALLNQPEPNSISFNPTNWRCLCITSKKKITLWQIERCSTLHTLKSREIKPPPADPDALPEIEEEKPLKSVSESSFLLFENCLHMPVSSQTGLVGILAERWVGSLQDKIVRVIPISQAWTPTGDLFIGCLEGELLKIDGESFKVTVIYHPSTQNLLPPSDANTEQSNTVSEHCNAEKEARGYTSDVTFECLGVHRKGLFAAGRNGNLNLVTVCKDKVTITNQKRIGNSVSSLAFSPSYKKIVLGSPQGIIQLCDTQNTDRDLSIVVNHHNGDFVGIGCLCPGTSHAVTVREDGFVQVWKLKTGFLIGSLKTGKNACSLACSPTSETVAVGTESGFLFILDLTDKTKPRIIHCIHLCSDKLSHLVYEDSGLYLFSASRSGYVFVISGKTAQNFSVLGYTVTKGPVIAMATSTVNNKVHVLVSVKITVDEKKVASKIIFFHIDTDFKNVIYKSLKLDFDDDSIEKYEAGKLSILHGLAVKGRYIYTISDASLKLLKLFCNDKRRKQPREELSLLITQKDYPAHSLAGGDVLLSPGGHWLVTCGGDGSVHLYLFSMLEHLPIKAACHSYRNGVRNIAMSTNHEYILATGYDGTLCCLAVEFNGENPAVATNMLDDLEWNESNEIKVKVCMELEREQLADVPDWPTVSDGAKKMEEDKLSKEYLDAHTSGHMATFGSDVTWLESKEIEALREEDKKYAHIKEEITTNLQEMKCTIQEMVKCNEMLPDIEKLERHEFDLDIEKQAKLLAEGEAEIQRVRENIEFENLARKYLRNQIKIECWDSMKVKGRCIKAFNSSLEVHNFPLKERPPSTAGLLEKIAKRRRIEMEEEIIRKRVMEILKKPIAQSLAEESDSDSGDSESEDKESGEAEIAATSGSLGAFYGGKCDILYNQLDLHTKDQKITQIILLKDIIYRVKENFNKEFEEVYLKKEQEFAKIKEKNKRIKIIYQDLDITDPIYEPTMCVCENPDLLLKVDDSEVTVEKYLTPEQWQKVEEEKKLEEERRLREKADNARERGLDKMMGGVLEIRREDELKKDISVPSFILTKDEEEWDEEEEKIFKEYQRKCKDLNEEREKFRRTLDIELKKIQAQIYEGMCAFDEVLNQLFLKNIKVLMCINQEELKMLRLKYSLLTEEELTTQQRELMRKLVLIKQFKVNSEHAVSDAKEMVTAFRSTYDNLVAEDRVMDKVFKKEFTDVTALQVDMLYKLFRKRPKVHRLKIPPTSVAVADGESPNPFAERPSTSRQNAQAVATMNAALEELDKKSNMLEGMEAHIWERFCRIRREKIKKEHTIKQHALTLAEMNAFLRNRQQEDDKLKQEIEDIFTQLKKSKAEEQQFIKDLDIQLLLKQGQVEIECGKFIPDYSGSVLVHINVVEEVNKAINTLGESKIASMVERKDFKKGIVQLEWEHRKKLMEIDDLQKRMKEIQFQKVTREIQLYLAESDYEAKRNEDIGILEQKIDRVKYFHDRNSKKQKSSLQNLKQTIKMKNNENENLKKDINEINVDVNERQRIDAINVDMRSDTAALKRYKDVLQRCKLVDLAKSQAQEVAVLRAEVERLRMKTFPALVQIE